MNDMKVSKVDQNGYVVVAMAVGAESISVRVTIPIEGNHDDVEMERIACSRAQEIALDFAELLTDRRT